MENIKEQEFKVIITKELFNQLTAQCTGVIQVNHYFVNGDISARIRESLNNYTVTYKKRLSSKDNIVNSIEYNQIITGEEFAKIIEEGISSVMISNITGLNLPELFYRTSLTTTRYTVNKFDLNIELDYNRYLNNEDYELECEYFDKSKLSELIGWLLINNIELTPSLSKCQRALNAFESTRNKLISNNYSTLLIDLDGTISDTHAGIIKCFNAVIKEFPLQEKHDFLKFIGPPLEETFSIIYKDKEIAAKAADLFRYNYKLYGKDENYLYSGVINMLERFSKDYRLIVCTGKFQPQAIEVLNRLNVYKYFDKVYGSRHDEGLINKSDIVAKLLKNENLPIDKCILIGDTVFDLLSAKANNIGSVGVLYGFGTYQELSAYDSLALVNNPYEIANLFGKCHE